MDLKKFIIIFLVFNFLAFISCLSHSSPENEGTKSSSPPNKNKSISSARGLTINSPKKNETFTIGDPIQIVFKKTSKNFEFDSVQINVDNENALLKKINELEYTLVTTDLKPGKRKLSAQIFLSSGKRFRTSTNFILQSDIVPKNLGYEILISWG